MLLVIFSISPNDGIAQRRREPTPDEFDYRYEMKPSNPAEDAFDLDLVIQPLSVRLGAGNMGIGANVGLNYHYKSKFGLRLDLYQAYADYSAATEEGSYVYDEGYTMNHDDRPMTQFEIIGELKLFDKSKTNVEERIKVGRGYKVVYVIDVKPATVFKGFYARAGYGYSNSVFTSSSLGTLKGVRVDDPTGSISEFAATGYQSMLQAHYLVFGVSYVTRHMASAQLWRKWKDAEEKTIGLKSVGRQSRAYLDIMAAVKSQIANMTVENYNYRNTPAHMITYRLDGVTKFNPIGLKVGYEISRIYRRVDLYYGVEGGINPGRPGVGGAFFALRAGIRLGVFGRVKHTVSNK